MTNDPNHRNGRPSSASENLNWLLANFVSETVGATEAIAVSADGFLLAGSRGTEAEGAEQLAAIVSSMTSLAAGAARLHDYGRAKQIIIELDRGHFFIMSINDGSTFGVLAEGGSDVGHIGYQMALTIERVGAVLTPRLVDQLKNALTSQHHVGGQRG